MSFITPRPGRPRPFVAEITDPKTGEVDHTKSFATKREAKAYITEQDGKKLTGSYVSPRKGRITVDERWQAWWPTVMYALRDSSRARDEAYYRSQVQPYLGDAPVGDLDHDRIQTWVSDLSKRHLKPETVRKAHSVLSKMLRGCVKAGLLASNQCEHTELPEVVINEMYWLTYDQVEDLVTEIDPRYALAVRLASYTGLRAGELFGLRVRDVKVDKNYINVRQKVTEVSGRLIITPYLKTENRNSRHFGGMRQIPVPPTIMLMLAERITDRAGDELVFTAPRGGTVRLSLFRNRLWAPAVIECGFGGYEPCLALEPMGCPTCHRHSNPTRSGHYDGLRIHDLRHTAVSAWIDQKRSMQEITKLLGQKNSDLVDRRYGHMRDIEHDAANAALDDAMLRAMAKKAGTAAPTVTPFRRRRSA